MMSYSKILPLLIIVSTLSFSVRLTEVITGVSTLSATAFAESGAAAETPADKKASDKASAAEKFDGEHADKKDKDNADVVEGKAAKAPKWQDASDSDLDVTGIKLEMFEDLSKRREQIESAEKSLVVREALLKATEQELDRKVQELTSLRKELEKLMEAQSGQEQQRIGSLVKIYEGMKPKDAARIFDTLDLDVLILVMEKMSERKVAPVLAAMNPERARTVTIMLAEQHNLPTLK